MLNLNPEENISKGKYFHNGVNYSSHNKGIGMDKPDPQAMRANYSTVRGIMRQDPKFIKEIDDEAVRQQKNMKWGGKIDSVLEFNLRKLLPQKVISFLYNMPKITPKRVLSYFRAELSNIEQGPVSLPIYEKRKKICGECPHRQYVEGYHDPLGFCTKCGCGANPRAQLTVKLKLPATSCPLGKWGESKGVYETLWGKIRYILSRNKKGTDNG